MSVELYYTSPLTNLGPQAYTSLLGVLAFTFSSGESGVVVTLITAWAVYAYRDVWPLMTYDLKPLDAAEGPILWAKIGILSLAAIVIPLTRSRKYVPYDTAVCHIPQVTFQHALIPLVGTCR